LEWNVLMQMYCQTFDQVAANTQTRRKQDLKQNRHGQQNMISWPALQGSGFINAGVDGIKRRSRPSQNHPYLIGRSLSSPATPSTFLYCDKEVGVQKSKKGQSIETLVSCFLEQQGFQCLEKNYYCRLGEIDLIMLDQSSNTLIFVEVRFRSHVSHGDGTESVDWKKQRKLKRTVLHYLQKHANVSQRARIDVVGVSNTRRSTNSVSDDVSIHLVDQYQLIWTRNAITD